MLVHRCLACGRISCNRVAGDDNAFSILKLLNEPSEYDEQTNSRLLDLNIHLLTNNDEDMVSRALLGNQYQSRIGE